MNLTYRSSGRCRKRQKIAPNHTAYTPGTSRTSPYSTTNLTIHAIQNIHAQVCTMNLTMLRRVIFSHLALQSSVRLFF
jgi:hypothetical protein